MTFDRSILWRENSPDIFRPLDSRDRTASGYQVIGSWIYISTQLGEKFCSFERSRKSTKNVPSTISLSEIPRVGVKIARSKRAVNQNGEFVFRI